MLPGLLHLDGQIDPLKVRAHELPIDPKQVLPLVLTHPVDRLNDLLKRYEHVIFLLFPLLGSCQLYLLQIFNSIVQVLHKRPIALEIEPFAHMSFSFREVDLLVFILLLPFLIEGFLVHEGVILCNTWVKHSIEVLLIRPLDVKRRVACLDLFVDLIDPPIKGFADVELLLRCIRNVDVLNLSLDVIKIILEVLFEDNPNLFEFLPVVYRIELEGRQENCGVV